MSEEFCREWLIPKLKSLDVDEEVFGNYIMGILTSDETAVEKQESLQDILSGAIGCDVSSLCDEIFEKWAQKVSVLESEKVVPDEKVSFDARLAVIMEKQAQSVSKVDRGSESGNHLKSVILAQFARQSDDEDPEALSYDEPTAISSVSGSIPQNMNADAVVHAEKELREKSKQEHENKKAQDKLNREKQKQKQQERKEKERKRTQKGERKR